MSKVSHDLNHTKKQQQQHKTNKLKKITGQTTVSNNNVLLDGMSNKELGRLTATLIKK